MRRRAVLFDVFGTLLRFHVERRPFATLLRGLALDRQQALVVRSRLMATSLPTLGEAAAAVTRWTGRVVPDAALDQAQRELDEHLASCRLADGATALLERLRAEGHAIALVSNLASAYVPVVERLGLRGLVDHAAFSCELGVLKPDPAIFRAALGAVGVSPGDATMVGDSCYDDVVGATTAGLRALWLTGAGDPQVHCVRDLSAVADALAP